MVVNVFSSEYEINAADKKQNPKFQSIKKIPTPHGSNFPFVSTGLCRFSFCSHRQIYAFPPQAGLSTGA